MKISAVSPGAFQIDLSQDELSLLWGCVNEATELGPKEFRIRTGVSIDEAFEMLRLFREAADD